MGDIVSSRLSNRIKELCSPFFSQSQFLFSLEALTVRPVKTWVAKGSFFQKSSSIRSRSHVQILMGQTITKVFVPAAVMIALICVARLEVANTGLGFHTS